MHEIGTQEQNQPQSAGIETSNQHSQVRMGAHEQQTEDESRNNKEVDDGGEFYGANYA